MILHHLQYYRKRERLTIDALFALSTVESWKLIAYERGLDCSVTDAVNVANALGVKVEDLTGEDKIEVSKSVNNEDLMRKMEEIGSLIEDLTDSITKMEKITDDFYKKFRNRNV